MSRTSRVASSVSGVACEPLEGRTLFSDAAPAAAALLPVVQVNPGFNVGPLLADTQQNVVYLLDLTNHKVVAVDTDLGRTVAHAAVPAPTALAISRDGTELYVSSSAANQVDVFALPDLARLRTFSIPTPGLLAATANDRLFVAGGPDGALRRVDARTGSVLEIFGRGFYNPLPTSNLDGTRLYVSALGLSTTGTLEFDVHDPSASPVFLREVNTNMANGRDLAVDDKFNRVYSMSGGVYGVWAVDLASNTGTLWPFGEQAAYGNDVALHPDSAYVFATSDDPYRGGVFQYDRATGALVATYHAAGQYKSTDHVAATGNDHAMYTAAAGTQLGLIGASSLVVGGVPDARFSASETETYVGVPVVFDASASRDYEAAGSITRYAWDFGDGSPPGGGVQIDHAFSAPGTYAVKLTVTENDNNTDDFVRLVHVVRSPVVGRHVFYRHSVFDAAGEDAAIAPDKQALYPGGDTAGGFDNITSYVKGINGVILDVASLPAGTTLGADDFEFRSRAGGIDAGWVEGPAPVEVRVRPGAGDGGSDRITLAWKDYNPRDLSPGPQAVANGWLEVTLKAGERTGLVRPEAFSFGNLIGEAGNDSPTLRVNAIDLTLVRQSLNTTSGVAGRYDFNRDGRVNALDLATVRSNLNRFLVTPLATAAPAPEPARAWDEDALASR